MKQNIDCKIYFVLMIFSMLIIVVLTFKNGGIWSTDSLNYFATAKNLLQTKTLTTYNGRPYILWPPLYPALLYVGLKFGLSLSFASVLINAIAFTLTCIFFYKTLTFFSENKKNYYFFCFQLCFFLHF